MPSQSCSIAPSNVVQLILSERNGDTFHVAPQGQRCHAAFTGDLAPALLVLRTDVEIAGMRGRRRIPLGDIYVEDGRAHLALVDDELVVAVHLPPASALSPYSKIRVRGAIDHPLAGVAVALGARSGTVDTLRIALTIRRTTSLNAGRWHKLLMP